MNHFFFYYFIKTVGKTQRYFYQWRRRLQNNVYVHSSKIANFRITFFPVQRHINESFSVGYCFCILLFRFHSPFFCLKVNSKLEQLCPLETWRCPQGVSSPLNQYPKGRGCEGLLFASLKCYTVCKIPSRITFWQIWQKLKSDKPLDNVGNRNSREGETLVQSSPFPTRKPQITNLNLNHFLGCRSANWILSIR